MSNIVSDLHVHTIRSDGLSEVGDVVDFAVKQALELLSITDHNVFLDKAALNNNTMSQKVKLIDGIEVSTSMDGFSLHILGYAKSFSPNSEFVGKLQKVHEGYVQRGARILAKMAAMGFPISIDEVYSRGVMYASRNVIAEIALKKYGKNKDDWLNVKVAEDDFFIDTADAIRLIHEAGGVALLAHPGTLLNQVGGSGMKAVIDQLIDHGLDGIEAYHPSQDNIIFRDVLTAIIKENKNLMLSGGSDSHVKDPGALGEFGLSRSQTIDFLDRLP